MKFVRLKQESGKLYGVNPHYVTSVVDYCGTTRVYLLGEKSDYITAQGSVEDTLKVLEGAE